MPGWWCGPNDREPLDHATLTPCTAETAGSPVLWIIAAAVLYTQIKRLQLLRRHRSYLGLGSYGVREAFVAAALVALTVSHAGWLVFYVWQHQAAFHYLYESTMLLYWGAALVGHLVSPDHLPCSQVKANLLHACAGCYMARKTAVCVNPPEILDVASSSYILLGFVHYSAHLHRALGYC